MTVAGRMISDSGSCRNLVIFYFLGLLSLLQVLHCPMLNDLTSPQGGQVRTGSYSAAIGFHGRTRPPTTHSSALRQRLRGGGEKEVAGKVLFDPKTRIFRLYSRSALYAFRTDDSGDLEHLYWGSFVPPNDDLRYLALSNVQLCFDPGPFNAYDTEVSDQDAAKHIRGTSFSEHFTRTPSFSDRLSTDSEWVHSIPSVGRNTKLLEYADLGTGDYRPQSFSVVYDDGGNICPLTYVSHEIIPGKLPMESAKGKSLWSSENVTLLPELRGGNTKDQCTTLLVKMEDRLTKLEFHLIYTVYKEVNAISRRVIVKNPSVRPSGNFVCKGGCIMSSGAVRLEKLMSATVDFHTMSGWNFITLSGSWANERHMKLQKLIQGKFVVESLRGASSHQHNPFCAVTTTPESLVETVGEVWAFSFIYSGNFKIEADVSETGRARVNAGINPSTFSWHLPPGDSFESPECVMIYSNSGLEGMSHSFHDLYRKYLIPERFFGTVPPVLLNTWEAMYFNVNHEKVVELARAASELGVEMIVLDDGWFGEREDATSSLGDWFEDRRKFPGGLPALVKDVNALGLKFGIWVEPEMVNVKSKLYKEHPSWTLNQHGRKSRCEGRNQLVLDFTCEDVCSYVISKLGELLSSSNIEYMKWDMNRHLTEVYGNTRAPDKQGEVFHRYMIGVYKVLKYLNEKFPHVRIETCSGGGGRFDPGMLFFSPQIWASDNTDVFSRMAIQHGTSLVYPLQSIGSHMTAVPNHQTQRLSTLKARFLVSTFGTFGLELDVRTLSESDKYELSRYIAKYKELAPVILSGRFYRLWSPCRMRDQQAYAWMCTSGGSAEHGISAVVAVFLTKMEPGHHLPRLRLRGLEEDENYVIEEIFPNRAKRNPSTGQIELTGGAPQWQLGNQKVHMSGATLMSIGLPIRLSFDGDCCAFVLTRARGVSGSRQV